MAKTKILPYTYPEIVEALSETVQSDLSSYVLRGDLVEVYNYIDTQLDEYILSANNVNTDELVSLSSEVISKINFNGNRNITRNISGLYNENVGGDNIKDFLNNLFFPRVNPSLSLTVSPNLNERGVESTINVNFNVNSNDYEISEYGIKSSDLLLLSSFGINENSSDSLVYSNNYSNSVNFEGYAYKTEGGIVSRTRSANYYDPFYYGVLTLQEIQSIEGDSIIRAEIMSILNKDISPKTNKSYTFNPNNQRIVVLYPITYGDFRSIIDQNGYDITSSHINTSFSYVRENSESVNYRICYSDADLFLNSFTINFIF